jgi:hypothetical protein
MSEGTIDSDELDAEALFQAYVNIVTGACIALGESIVFFCGSSDMSHQLFVLHT